MQIAIISDKLTTYSISKEINTKYVTPKNYKAVLKYWKPDFLFVESVWNGENNIWKYKVSKFTDTQRNTFKYKILNYTGIIKYNNVILKNVVEYAKDLNIPTVFWNKEDGVHFDRFIDSARLFDHIFTVDENCIEKYKAIVDENVTVNTLMFGVQSKFHNFTGFNFKYNHANFVGSYSHHIHDKRRTWQDMMFDSASKTGLGLDVFDRNSDRKSQNYRYPNLNNMNILPAVEYKNTAQIYKDYVISLNVNTIEDSPTMFSRRLVEILACGGIAVTNPTMAVDALFKEYCNVVSTQEEMDDFFSRIYRHGLSEQDKEMARAGAEYVAKYHTWTNRLEEIKKVLKI